MVIMLRAIVRPRVVEAARKQAERNVAGKMEGHAAMDMSVKHGTFLQKVTSREGSTAISHYYYMNWYSLWGDIVLGLVISGVMAAFVPHSFWQGFFLESHPLLAKLWGPFIGPLVAVVTFVCSVGNVPMAAVLWNGGISFGGVLSFLFADLIIVPLLNIYRKYYGGKIAVILFFVFYAAMALAALAVEGIFSALHWIPSHRSAMIMEESIRWNYTSVLNIAFLLLSALMLVRFLKTGGPAMLKEMDEVPAEGQGHCCHHG